MLEMDGAGTAGKKNARGFMPAPSLQRRNRGETIKKQLLHLNEFGLSRSWCMVSMYTICKSAKNITFCRAMNTNLFESENRALACAAKSGRCLAAGGKLCDNNAFAASAIPLVLP
ncbi:hypothetical protein ACFOLG_16725 [Vogesella facilis]|uniref:Uncharacterized protein n=1 Tax=Vogesella facilis TaxID=1655232 RepID=A0ABV7RKI9_9NEIS